jgi:hypothetical protein
MEIQPYSIHYENRPLKIAFLVDPTIDSSLWIDNIVQYNRDKWGGRYNPIIFTDGSTITDTWWKFLRDFDPDVIYTTKELTDELRERIQIFLTPFYVQTARSDAQGVVHLSDDPVSILPTRSTIASIAMDILSSEYALALFDIDEGAPEDIKNFVIRNFGNYRTGQRAPLHLQRALEGVTTKVYPIKDKATLNDALKDLGDFKTRVVFPSQICTQPSHVKDVEYDHRRQRFEVIVGDNSDELVYSWNRALCMRDWLRNKITQLWVPESLILEAEIKEGLNKFINRYTGSVGDNNHHEVSFVSFSLEETKLQEISTYFDGATFYPKTVTKYSESVVPDFSPQSTLFITRRGLDFFRANSLEEHLVINEPEIQEGGMGGQYWITNLYIQYRPEKYQTIQGMNHWWQFPKRNGLLSGLRIFNKEARINELGLFSVLMKRKTSFDPDEKTLVIKLPHDNSVFSALICGESYKNIDTNPQSVYTSSPFYVLQTSNMGKYMRGVLNLFPDLHGAYRLIERRYWRRMFEIMSNQGNDSDKQQVKSLVSEFKKKISSNVDLTTDVGLKWLAQRTINLSKNARRQGRDILFRKFVEEAVKETDEYNKLHPSNKFQFQGADLKEEITDLVESNILLAGVSVNCPMCGDKSWFQIDEIKQWLKCRGCGHEFVMQAEERWSYRLNNMVREAFAEHGTIPVLLTLGQLFSDSRSSFMYVPSKYLFTEAGYKKKKPEPYTEIDIACIVDGQFIIGEVKQSMDFHQGDFSMMKDLAEKLKPNKVIFSSLLKPNNFVKGEINKLKTQLAELEIEVVWYQIYPNIFEPWPVR